MIQNKKNTALFILIILFHMGFMPVRAQTDVTEKADETLILKKHSPKKATLWALIPGAGQIYNKKYWKLPIVYAGFAVTGYFAVTNGQEYRKFRDAYSCAVVSGEECTNELAIKYEFDTDNLQTYKDYYRRNMELSYIIMGAWYVLQMLDATVDAHLYYWEVDDKLSVRVDPLLEPVNFNPGSPLVHGSVTPNGIRITVSF